MKACVCVLRGSKMSVRCVCICFAMSLWISDPKSHSVVAAAADVEAAAEVLTCAVVLTAAVSVARVELNEVARTEAASLARTISTIRTICGHNCGDFLVIDADTYTAVVIEAVVCAEVSSAATLAESVEVVAAVEVIAWAVV